jgi:hypothetical protein
VRRAKEHALLRENEQLSDSDGHISSREGRSWVGVAWGGRGGRDRDAGFCLGLKLGVAELEPNPGDGSHRDEHVKLGSADDSERSVPHGDLVCQGFRASHPSTVESSVVGGVGHDFEKKLRLGVDLRFEKRIPVSSERRKCAAGVADAETRRSIGNAERLGPSR